MESLVRWGAATCGCDFNIAQDPATGKKRYVTREEAVALHQTLYDNAPWLVRLYNPITNQTSAEIPEGQEVALLQAGWMYLSTIEPDFPRRFKNILNPSVNPQPRPTLCADHQALGHTKARHDAVWYETKRMEKAHSIILALRPLATWEDLGWSFQPSLAVDAEVKGARLLVLTPPTLTPTDKTFLSAAINLEFGPGQVRVD